MKKICSLIFFVIFAGQVFAKSDTIRNPSVPKEIMASFAKAHPNAKLVCWSKSNSIYIASYREDNVNEWTTFDSEGSLLENKWKIIPANLPSAIQDYIKTNNTQGIQEYYKIVDATGTVNYEVHSLDKSYIFDSEGLHFKTIETLKK